MGNFESKDHEEFNKQYHSWFNSLPTGPTEYKYLPISVECISLPTGPPPYEKVAIYHEL